MAEEENELVLQRRRKLEELQAAGEVPFKSRFDRTHTINDVVAKHSSLEPARHTGETVSVAGRIVAMRRHGKASFAEIRDGSGKIQLFLAVDALGEEAYERFLSFDIGDFVGVNGEVFKTKRGELSVAVAGFDILTKSLRPLPEKWHGLKDIEARYRQRYLDLLMNSQAAEVFKRKTETIKAIRVFLDELGFVEVETPMLQPIPGGAAARPFVTFHNALDTNLYLRIAPELYLKRLIIGGVDKVYELNKSFRNEGISVKHNPEFLMLEVYQAYADYHDMMELTEALIASVVERLTGGLIVEYQGRKIDFTRPWPRTTMLEAIETRAQVTVSFDSTLDDLRKVAGRLGVEIEPRLGKGGVIAEIFEKKVEHLMIEPTFVLDYPREISPLAKAKPDNPELTERFELIVTGWELANAFSELTDPIDQRARFEEQLKTGRAEEVHEIDESFLTAMEHGMPPTGGLGIGIDRLVMLLTDSPSIRDVILFPQLKSKTED